MSENDQLSLFGLKQRITDPSSRQIGWWEQPFLVVDTETTGLHPQRDKIIEIAWVVCEGGHAISQGSHLIKPQEALSREVQKLTGINDDMLQYAPNWKHIMPKITELFEKSDFIVAYNADFDRRFIEHAFEREATELIKKPWVDPYVFIKDIDKYKKGKKLIDSARRWGIPLNGAHRALADAAATAALLLKMQGKIGIHALENLLTTQATLKEEQERDFQAYLKRKKASVKEQHD